MGKDYFYMLIFFKRNIPTVHLNEGIYVINF